LIVAPLGLLGLLVAAVLGTAIISVPVVALAAIGWYFYKRMRAARRYGRPQW
jgi:hypothetical protein